MNWYYYTDALESEQTPILGVSVGETVTADILY